MKILLVDDDAALRESVRSNLEAEAFAVDVAGDGKEGSYLARTNHYDLVILDYSMPEKNGSVVCEEIRSAGSSVPIIFLSVMDEVDRKVSLLERGADDFLAKPFSYAELSARVKAVLRRPQEVRRPVLSAGGIAIDTGRQTAAVDGKPVYLTRKEYTLLEYLFKNKGSILSRSAIMEHVWNAESDPFSNTIESHIVNLRKKIRRPGQTLIRNIPGRGYLIPEID